MQNTTSPKGYATPSAAIAATCENEQEQKKELEYFIWDTYKKVHGIKPRWYNFSDWNIAELREEADSLGAAVVAIHEREKQIAKNLVIAANKRAVAKRNFDRNFNALAVALANALGN